MSDIEREWRGDPDVARAMQILTSAKSEARARTIEANQDAEHVLESRLIMEKISKIDDNEPRFVRIERNGKSSTTQGVSAAGEAAL